MKEIYELLHPFLQVIAGSLRAGRVSIVTPNGDGTLSPKVGLGLPGRAYKPVLWDMGRISAYVMETRTPLLTSSSGEGEVRFKLNRSGYTGDSFISAPLIVNGDIWGVINLSDKEDGLPFDEEDLRKLSEHISALTEFIKRITALRSPALSGSDDSMIEERLVGSSEKILKVRRLLKTLSETDVTVFIKGETGTGKSLAAKLLHDLSPRGSKPFVKVNCAALPETLLEAELFGYERGAFTGAFEKKPGKFEIANHGTILLDEISELDIKLQAKLLQVIEDKEYPRIGGKDNIKVDVRILATSNLDLAVALAENTFRRDLFYRLNEASIHMPPLRERTEDIPILLEHFLDLYNRRYKRSVKPPSDKVMKVLMSHTWPGNVRELEALVKRYVIFENEATLTTFDVEPQVPPRSIFDHDPEEGLLEINKKVIAAVERDVLTRVLNETRWNKSKAAKILKISYKTLLEKIKQYNLEEK